VHEPSGYCAMSYPTSTSRQESPHLVVSGPQLRGDPRHGARLVSHMTLGARGCLPATPDAVDGVNWICCMTEGRRPVWTEVRPLLATADFSAAFRWFGVRKPGLPNGKRTDKREITVG